MPEQKPNLFNWLTSRLYELEITASKIRRLAWATDILSDGSWEQGIFGLGKDATADWLLAARKQFADEKLISTDFSFRGAPRFTLWCWLTKWLSREIANDFDEIVSQFHKHWCVLPKLRRRIESTETEEGVTELRLVLDRWSRRSIYNIVDLRQRIEAVHFTMGWQKNSNANKYSGLWQGYELDSVTSDSNPELQDGLYRADKLLVWGGLKYEWLTETMMDALELLVDTYPECVKPSAMEHKVGRIPDGGFKKIFKTNRGGISSTHPVAELIGGRSPKGWFLIK